MLLLLALVTILIIDKSSSIQQRIRVMVLGGSGRVGGSAVRSLCERYGDTIDIFVGGRDKDNWHKTQKRLLINAKNVNDSSNKALEKVEFVQMDLTDQLLMEEYLPKYDLTIHTAGPFQGLDKNIVLETCLKHGKKYLDVCDDISLSRITRSSYYQDLAKRNGGSAIISTGIWPGGSSLLAQEAIEVVGGSDKVEKCTFTFFTAGSGGAGKTILTATFLLLGEDVLTYQDGKIVYMKSASDKTIKNFGTGIGIREVVRLNLIECESCHVSSKIKNVETYFGTAPYFWNTLFFLMANIIPQSILKNRQLMSIFAGISLPMVRLVDSLVGSSNGIRVDLLLKSGETYTSLLTHNDLETSVGDAIGAFASQILIKDRVNYGVFFPEEVTNVFFRKEILNDIRKKALFDRSSSSGL